MKHTSDQTVDSYYQASRRYVIAAEQLRGEHKVDVVVIGGGLSGVSAALHLAEQGVAVAVLEAHDFGWGASGRSGGQIISGYSASQQDIEKLVGLESAQELWQHSLAALAWTRQRIAKHHIDCDLASGYLHVAVNPAKARALQHWANHLTRQYDCQDLAYLERDAVQQIIGSKLYHGAIFDPASGHLHPLNYCLGLAQAAQQAGAYLYQDSPVLSVKSNRTTAALASPTKVYTKFGVIACNQVIYACNAYLDRLQPHLAKSIMPVGTYIIATEPLSADLATELIANRAAVADTNMVLDYYRLSVDNRMLFGGRVSYSTLAPRRLAHSLRRRMLRVFPQLADVRIDFAWGGHVAITRNRAPHIGQLDSTSWFSQGFSGQGMALSGYVGGLLAEAVMGDVRRIQCFQKIPHKAFIGGPMLRMPALVLGMAYQRLRDKMH